MRWVLLPIAGCLVRCPMCWRAPARRLLNREVFRLALPIGEWPGLRTRFRRALVRRPPRRMWWTCVANVHRRAVGRCRRFLVWPRSRRPAPGAKTAAELALAALASGKSVGLPVVGGLGEPGGIVPGRNLVVLLSDENGQFSPVTVSSDLFRPVPRSVFASFFDAPRAFRWSLAGLLAVLLLFGAAYISMAVVSSRYQFREVAVSPGRSVYYKVDSWTGRMTRCRTDVGGVGPVC